MLLGGIGYVAIMAWYYSISAYGTGEDHALLSLLLPADTENGQSTFAPVNNVLVPVFIAWNVALMIVTVLVIVDAVRKVRSGQAVRLTTGVFMVKLAAILYFIANFALLTLITVSSALTVIFGGFVGLAAVAGATVLTYLTMATTSIYGWASVRALHRDRRIGSAQAAIYAVLLCIFVLDVLGGILLFAEARRKARAVADPAR
jgi:glutamate mutase epsilon subunit